MERPVTVLQPSEPGTESRLAIEVAGLFPPQGQWTEEDYFALPDSNRYIELSDGIFIMPPHPTNTHQRTVGRLFRSLEDFGPGAPGATPRAPVAGKDPGARRAVRRPRAPGSRRRAGLRPP